MPETNRTHPMLVQQAIAFVADDIAQVGALMRDLSGRYEAIFSNLRSALAVTLAQSPTMADAAREATALADAASAAIRDHAALSGGLSAGWSEFPRQLGYRGSVLHGNPVRQVWPPGKGAGCGMI
eukprot:gene42822-57978_t